MLELIADHACYRKNKDNYYELYHDIQDIIAEVALKRWIRTLLLFLSTFNRFCILSNENLLFIFKRSILIVFPRLCNQGFHYLLTYLFYNSNRALLRCIHFR